MIKLYGHPYSANARKVHWTLEELDLSYEYKTVDLSQGEQKTAEFLAINPAGKIPVIVDGDLTLPESNAIVTYLASNYGRGKLLSEDKAAFAQVLRWLFWQTADGSTSLSRPFYLKFVVPILAKQPFNEVAHQQAVAEAAPPLKFLDAALAHSAYLTGDHFTIADIVTGELAALAQIGGVELSQFANLTRWLTALAARPAFIKTRPKLD